MNPNTGKTSFSNKNDAEAAATKMSRKFSQPFAAYQSKGKWYVGGKFIKHRPQIKVKGLLDLKEAWQQFQDDQNDPVVNDYIETVEATTAQNTQESMLRGDDGIWTLLGLSEKRGTELGFRNDKIYLVLEVGNGHETIHLKMGGAFARHIPLMTKVAQSLLDQPIVWSTWNKVGQTQWLENEWFYRLDLNEEVLVEGD